MLNKNENDEIRAAIPHFKIRWRLGVHVRRGKVSLTRSPGLVNRKDFKYREHENVHSHLQYSVAYLESIQTSTMEHFFENNGGF